MPYPKIVWENKEKNLSSQDKKKAEVLVKQITQLINHNDKAAQKAALLIEYWIHGRKKR